MISRETGTQEETAHRRERWLNLIKHDEPGRKQNKIQDMDLQSKTVNTGSQITKPKTGTQEMLKS